MPPPTMTWSRISVGTARDVILAPAICMPSGHVASTSRHLPRLSRRTIEDHATDRIGPLLDEARAPARRFIVSSPLVWRLHGPAPASGTASRTPSIIVPDRESVQQLATGSRIY